MRMTNWPGRENLATFSALTLKKCILGAISRFSRMAKPSPAVSSLVSAGVAGRPKAASAGTTSARRWPRKRGTSWRTFWRGSPLTGAGAGSSVTSGVTASTLLVVKTRQAQGLAEIADNPPFRQGVAGGLAADRQLFDRAGGRAEGAAGFAQDRCGQHHAGAIGCRGVQTIDDQGKGNFGCHFLRQQVAVGNHGADGSALAPLRPGPAPAGRLRRPLRAEAASGLAAARPIARTGTGLRARWRR